MFYTLQAERQELFSGLLYPAHYIREEMLKLSAEYEASSEFLKKIIVHGPGSSIGHRCQKIQLVWNFIGELKQDEDAQTITI